MRSVKTNENRRSDPRYQPESAEPPSPDGATQGRRAPAAKVAGAQPKLREEGLLETVARI